MIVCKWAFFSTFATINNIYIIVKGKKATILIIISALVIIGLIAATIVTLSLLSKPIKSNSLIYIDRGTTTHTLHNKLTNICGEDAANLIKRAYSITGKSVTVNSGCYMLTPDMRVIDIFNLTRNGSRKTTTATFNNARLKEDVAEKITRNMIITQDTILSLLNDTTIYNKLGMSEETILAIFLPDTYTVYLNGSANYLINRMKYEYDQFWNESRLKKAANAGLTPIEVSILASIVQEETKAVSEMDIVAGLYINRLRRGMPLQSDPTVKFAVGDFGLKRILNKHLEIDSPYNTYKYKGLPPGLICVPSKSAIDAVLNYKKSNYLYMCAKEDMSGKHNFASTYAAHQWNATKYRQKLNSLKIYK